LSFPYRSDRLWGPTSPLYNLYQMIFLWRKIGRSVKLTAHLHAAPRSRKLGFIHSLPHMSLHGVALSLPSKLTTSSYLSDSLWRRQSQQSFNTLTPFNFLFYSLHVSAPMGHPHVRYTISYYFCFWRTILIQRIRCTYVIWLFLYIYTYRSQNEFGIKFYL
jgi:hypothetical protein